MNLLIDLINDFLISQPFSFCPNKVLSHACPSVPHLVSSGLVVIERILEMLPKLELIGPRDVQHAKYISYKVLSQIKAPPMGKVVFV